MPNQPSENKATMTFSFLKTFLDRLRGTSKRTGETATSIVQRGTENEMDLLELERLAAEGKTDPEMVKRLRRLHTRLTELETIQGEMRANLDEDK